MPAISVGVDFGTSNTVVALVDANQVARVLSVASRAGIATTLPSVLCLRPNELNRRERPVSSAGADAIADYLGRSGPARLVQSMKASRCSRRCRG